MQVPALKMWTWSEEVLGSFASWAVITLDGWSVEVYMFLVKMPGDTVAMTES